MYFYGPAGTVNFNHTNGCQKCEVTGKYNSSFRHMSYPDMNASRRTNESFRERKQHAHHKIASPFQELDIDMVKAFTISDSLHLLHHGVMKKLLRRWIGKVKGYCKKWTNAIIDSVSQYLLDINKRMPSEIHRQMRSLKEICKWKGVEFLVFLCMLALLP